jgi:7,8-dihydropterin-6-yl-methyl-4-(beta-D-ribofuranosyl)aminobenzene 5'-phosphate synthase
MQQVKLKILAENRVENPLLIAEQGLSILVEVDDQKILFDTGQGNAIIHNAEHLGVDLKEVGWIILSHGHYDHVGGIMEILKLNPRIKIIAHPYIFNKKYVKTKGNKRFIGIPTTREDLEKRNASLILKNNKYEILPGVYFSGEIMRLTDYEQVESKYFERVLESEIPDHMKDEAFLVINTPKGLIILSGCGHVGIVNTCKHALKITKQKKILLVMGGMHLKNASDNLRQATLHDLMDINPDQFAPLHCTGFQMIKDLISNFGEKKVQLMNVGDEIQFTF